MSELYFIYRFHKADREHKETLCFKLNELRRYLMLRFNIMLT